MEITEMGQGLSASNSSTHLRDIPRQVSIGIQSFSEIIEENVFYVDKTSFIGEWYRKKDPVTLITRPRRFGKTLTADMLDCFFSPAHKDDKHLFENLAIGKDPEMMKLQGTIPTIKISLAAVKATTFQAFLKDMAGVISSLYSRFGYLEKSEALSEDDKILFKEIKKKNLIPPAEETKAGEMLRFIDRIENSVSWLSEWLYTYYGEKVMIFLDEYDTPIQAAYLHHYYDEAIPVMREFLFNSFKGNTYLKRAFLTGITRIAKESLFSEMNNLAAYSVIHGGYDTAFGFTKEEMKAVLAEYGVADQTEKINYWYDGFTIGQHTNIYNPWSVTCFLSNRPLPPEAYWSQSGGVGLIDYLMKRGGRSLMQGMQELLQGNPIKKKIKEDLIFPRLSTDENAVWSLLVAAGYLKPLFGISPEEECVLTLTNHEAFASLAEMVEGWFASLSGNFMQDFVQALLENNLSEMNRCMKEIVLQCVSNFDTGVKPAGSTVHPENFFHGMTLGMLICISGKYRIRSNTESGFGRFDLCLEPLAPAVYKNAYILEFKVFNKAEGDKSVLDTARRARRQIDEKRYDTDLVAKGYPGNEIRKYGFGFRGKEVLLVE